MQNNLNDASKNLKQSDADSENQKLSLCPKCHSENTQKVEMAYLSGRFKGTPLASQIQPPREPELLPNWFLAISAVSGILLVWWQFKLFHGMPWTQEFLRWHSHIDAWESIVFMAKIVGIGLASMLVSWWAFSGDLKKRKDKLDMSHDYLKAKDKWKYEYICHKCGHRYMIRPNP